MQGNQIAGQVIYVDHFGNLVTNIPRDLLSSASRVDVEYRARRMEGLHRTFHDDANNLAGEPLALVGSNGYLEIAVPNGNAASLLGGGPGDAVAVETD